MVSQHIDLRSFHAALERNYALVLTSSDVEKKAANDALDGLRPADIGTSDAGCRIGLLDGRMVVHLTGEAGGSRDRSTGRLVRRILDDPERPNPCLIVLAGICWGNPHRAAVGDVILSTNVVSMNHMRLEQGANRRIALPLTSTLQIDELFLEAAGMTVAGQVGRIVSGPLASLETFIKSDQERDSLLASFPYLFGGEMEAYDFLPSCKDIPWLVLKGVSDLAENDLSRSGQAEAAGRAIAMLRPLLSFLQSQQLLPRPAESAEVDSLCEVIAGNSIVVRARQVTANSLNDYLNNDVGARVMTKLRRYSSDLEFGAAFPPLFCDLILEVAQNALRHGRATGVEILFSDGAVTMIDDGDPFDLGSLAGNRGGATAWRAMKSRFLDRGDVGLRTRPGKGRRRNKYTFRLNRHDRVLRHAMQNCRVTIASEAIGAPMGRPDVLRVNDECDAVYMDARDIRMSSRRMEIGDAVRRLAEAGKLVFVACNSDDDVVLFKAQLAGIAPDRVRVFIETRG